MKFKNSLDINNVIQEKQICHYGKDGKSWSTLSLIVTPSKTLYEVEYYNKSEDYMSGEIFEDIEKAKRFAKKFKIK